MGALDAARLGRLNWLRNPAEAPIFVVGCGHTGTTVMRAILGSHPAIHGIPFESELLRLPTSLRGWPRWRTVIKRRPLRSFVDWTYESRSMGKRRWVEKTPRHVHSLDIILRLLPSSRVVIMVRDGLDVVASLHARGFSLDESISRWRTDTLAGLNYENEPRCLHVRYEDLVTDTEITLERVCAFIGETFEPDMLRYHDSPAYQSAALDASDDGARRHDDRRREQVSTPLFDGRGRWRDLLSEAEADAVEAELRDVQRRIDSLDR